MVTPRLAALSPVRECGKTLLFDLLRRLTFRPSLFINPTAAAVYYQIDAMQGTVLVDEGDNLSQLNRPGTMRTVFNTGHREGGSIPRVTGKALRLFRTFSPLAIAAIGSLPLPLLSRTIVLKMQRAPKRIITKLERFDPKNPEQIQMLDQVQWYIYQWSRQCTLGRDPPMPE
jgi:hypothetical protein